MPNQTDFYRQLTEMLEKGERVALATVMSASGSVPRRAGAKMIVREDGGLIGTIGGGLLEAMVIELAEEVVAKGRAVCRSFSLTQDMAAKAGMVCGGSAEILVDFCEGRDAGKLELFRQVGRSLSEKRKACLVTAMHAEGERLSVKTGLLEKGEMLGGELDPSTLPADIRHRSAGISVPSLLERGESRFFIEALRRPASCYIYGAGHISQQLAPLCAITGFGCVVLDDREEFANRERFPTVDQVVVLDSFDRAFEDLALDADSFIVILTRGHAHDGSVLAGALKTDAGYIGMIGSRRKREVVYASLLEAGFSSDDLERVHCPIGLNIGADSPEEIAVSIVGELIQKRAERNPASRKRSAGK